MHVGLFFVYESNRLYTERNTVIFVGIIFGVTVFPLSEELEITRIYRERLGFRL